jgi:hypothetical protein
LVRVDARPTPPARPGAIEATARQPGLAASESIHPRRAVVMRTTIMGATAILVVAAASACADQTPTSPARPTAPTATVAEPVIASTSTICVGYAHRRIVSQMKLEAAQEHHASKALLQKLSDDVDHLDAISRDACN